MLFAVLLALTPVTLTFWDVVIVMEVLPLLNCAEPLPCVVDRLSVIDEVFEAGETVTEYTSEPPTGTPRGPEIVTVGVTLGVPPPPMSQYADSTNPVAPPVPGLTPQKVAVDEVDDPYTVATDGTLDSQL